MAENRFQEDDKTGDFRWWAVGVEKSEDLMKAICMSQQ